MSVPALWTLVLAEAGAAASLLALADPPAPRAPIPPGPGIALGAAAGLVLVTVLARRPPVPLVERRRVVPVSAIGIALVIGAAFEETIWRWLLIGALSPVLGPGVALGISTASFAIVHARQAPRAFLVHLLTGASFGAVFLATGSVAAAIVAHAAYNLGILVLTAADRARCSAAARPGPAGRA